MFFATNGLDALHAQMGSLLDAFLQPERFRLAGRSYPYPVFDCWEEENAYYAEATVPGLSGDDLEVTLTGNDVTVKGARMHGKEDVARHRQIPPGFERILRMPEDVDAEKVEACLKDGILTIQFPKSEALKPRRIEVKAQQAICKPDQK